MPSRNRLVPLAVAVPIATLLLSVVVITHPAGATSIVFGAGTFTANTTTLSLTGPSVHVTGTVHNGVAVFQFGNVTIPNGATITAMGARPFELVATGNLLLGGVIVSNGVSATENVAGPYAGGAGGGAGGADGTAAGIGPGHGGHGSTISNGGGGGGFATAGAPGGLDVGGGGGGGAIGLFAKTIVIQNTAGVIAVGGSGSGGGDGASGGGSGGGIILHASTILLNGILVAGGGSGGTGGCCGDGGGGAGGRIAIQYGTLSSASVMTTVVVGGSSGTSGTLPHGETSADPTGGAGIVTYTHIDATALTIGPSKSVHKGLVPVTTRLTDGGTGTGITGARVGLFRRMLTGGPWKLAASKVTGAGGQAAATVNVTASAQYEWRYAGALIFNPGTSPVQSLVVVP